MRYFKHTIVIRINEATENRVSDIMRMYPEDYRNRSMVYRAGVEQLFNWKISKSEE